MSADIKGTEYTDLLSMSSFKVATVLTYPYFHLTPASAAVHVLAICVRKKERSELHTNGQRVRCRLHALVMRIYRSLFTEQ